MTKTLRRGGRVCALQILYQMDLARQLRASGVALRQVEDALGAFWASFGSRAEVDSALTEELVRGVCTTLPELDASLEATSHHWKLRRMDKVDRNVLRLAAYEILHCPDMPSPASINEAIEIVKEFSHAESAAFVNGILDQFVKRQRDEQASAETADSALQSAACAL